MTDKGPQLYRVLQEGAPFVAGEKFPFVFLEPFARFVESVEVAEVYIYRLPAINALMPIKLKRGKILGTAKCLYPPLTDDGQRLSVKDEQVFVDSFYQYVKKKGWCHRIVQPENFAVFKAVPTGAISAPFGTYKLNLKPSEDELFKSLHGKHRNVIRNAMKKGAELKVGLDQLDVFYELYQQTMARSGMYCESRFWFAQYAEKLGEEQLYCAVVYHEGKPQGALLCPVTQFAGYYVFGASAERIELTGAVNFLHWEFIKFMKSKGVDHYDMVGARLSDVSGTKLEGIQKFKARFGGELDEGYLWKADIGTFRLKIYDTIVRSYWLARRVSLRGDIIDQERAKT